MIHGNLLREEVNACLPQRRAAVGLTRSDGSDGKTGLRRALLDGMQTEC